MSACGYEHGLMTVDEAIQSIVNTPVTLPSVAMPLKNSLSRYLSGTVYSSINLPHFDQSAVDGYALCSDQSDARHQTFELIGEIRAGSASPLVLEHGQAVRIFTGGKLPQGTTTVARQEIVEQLSKHQICITDHLAANVDIRRTGEELAQGQLLADVGQFLNIGSLAALSMAGIQTLNVYRPPKVAVLITGDEIALDQNSLSESQIFDANGPLLENWLQQYGITAQIIHVADQAHDVTAHFERLKNEYDVIITTGGVSVGDYDFVRPCSFEAGFKQMFWKVAQKPGKPLYFGSYQNLEHHCYLLGLPGNPAAVYVCMQIYGKLLLDALQNKRQIPSWFTAKITHAIKPDARERFLRMVATFNESTLEVRALPKQQSHMLSNLIQSNCLIRIPAGRKIETGELVHGLFI
ncbi:molybdopterin molybdotransferase MoeA [Acinetobacter ihumii]|uniref:molybdopterin molybdotransferase MoeA n=1 Tax=Acinetobacter ihumii TaxID=2483802 RepID=UPI0010323FA9|nr:molybdopterin molybdotransferase MoeA [Acinetobacter ihumii]